MVDLEIFDPSEPTLLNCTRLCFMSILRKELTDIANEWNPHLLSQKRKNTPSGRLDIMYFLPYFYETIDRVISIKTPKTDKFINITSAVLSQFSDELGEFVEILLNE